MLVPIKADLITKKRNYKEDMVGAKGAGNIKMIFAFLGGI